MNVYQYIDKYGSKSFQEEALNEVDAMLFSFIAYAKYDRILDRDSKMTIHDIALLHIEKYPEKDEDIYAIRKGNELLRYIKDTKRYKDCFIYNYEYIGNKITQFSAITIEYEEGKVFVAFEGTDSLFSGWMEDFYLGCYFPTKTQKLARHYLNKHFTFSNKRIIVGGHSKGGNLALAASMLTNFLVRMKIDRIYNGDGPGLLEKDMHSNKYKRIEDRYCQIIPYYSVVGTLLNSTHKKIVDTATKSILSHSITYWDIEENHFKYTNQSPFSIEIHEQIENWLKENTVEEIENMIKDLNDILEKANVTNIVELKKDFIKVLYLLDESKEIDLKTRKELQELLQIVLKCIEKTKEDEFKKMFHDFITLGFKNGIK